LLFTVTKIMKAINRQQAIDQMNHLGSKQAPFLFVLDFDLKENYVIPKQDIDSESLLVSMEGFCNIVTKPIQKKPRYFNVTPISQNVYDHALLFVKQEIANGNSYLLNLTFPTKIETDLSLLDIFYNSFSAYKLYFDNRFVCFSPETFVKINDGIISSCPMKGTIDANLPNAEEMIINDLKETAEHNTIVDLIRNDLSIVSNNVHVKRFRYIDRIKTNFRELLQVSSEICGELNDDYFSNLGNIIFNLLPAGSVTGAPKRKTVEIIKKAEGYERGFYTGIFGYFNGVNLNSAVMIRFIERHNDRTFWYKSGGGITALSNPEKEYKELIDKVYVPVA
jgi:para-aminobenzoate synthetase component I